MIAHVPLTLRSLRLAAALLVASVIALGSLPVTAASAAPSTAKDSAAQDSAARAASHSDTSVRLDGDAKHATSTSARRASYAWTGRRITFYESMPTKWDWSLSTALNKWNHSGGGIRFVRTTNRRAAELNIAYANMGAASGMATVGRTSHAYVHLSTAYRSVDALDAHYRIEVMMVFAHELGHVLGFEHTKAACSLMAPMLDVEGCNMIPRTTKPGYYNCRTIDTALVARFVRLYGGHAKYPTSWCAIDKIPAPLTRVDFAGGPTSPVTISWVSPEGVPSGSNVLIRSWQSDQCGAVPDTAGTTYAPLSAGSWQDSQVQPVGTSCYSVQLVNRYGAGQSGVARMIAS
jgi:hypothetical protein